MRLKTCKVCRYKWNIQGFEENKAWAESKLVCPSCGNTYCNKPETERKLFNLQDEYLEKGRNVSVLESMCTILLDYAENLIKKHYSNILIFGDIVYYAENAVSFFQEEYLRKPSFKVRSSFAGYLKRKILQAVYGENERGKKSEETELSTDYVFEDGHFVTYEDIRDGGKFFTLFEAEEENFNLLLTIINIMESFFKEEDHLGKLLCLFSFELLLNKKKWESNELFNVYSIIDGEGRLHKRIGKYTFIKFLDAVAELLKKAK